METNRKAAFLTLGCKLNYAETSTYERGFVEAGFEVVPWNKAADLYLINTCAVTEVAEKKSRNLIRKVHRVNPEAVIVVTGCYAQLRAEQIAAIDGVARVFKAGEKAMVVPQTLSLFGIGEAVDEEQCPSTFGAFSTGERTRSFLKVQDGCNNFCAYCTVPYARGESRNIPICEAVRAAEQIAASGCKEIVLTGVNTGDFGRTTGESFLDLLKALDRVDGIERYRISSIEPNLLTDEIIDWIASGTKVLPHFHIPLQTGTDELLSLMGRHYDTAFFRARIERIRSAMEGPGRLKVFFGIDVMVGLPGETDEMFQQTADFIESINPAFIHVFPYSRRPGTPAAQMASQVSESKKAERVAKLDALCQKLNSAFIESNRGLRSKVLFESSVRDGRMEGYTENYIRIERPYDPSLVGQISEEII